MARKPNFCLVAKEKDGTRTELLWFDAQTKVGHDLAERFARQDGSAFPVTPAGSMKADEIIGRQLYAATELLKGHGIDCAIEEMATA